ncbi:conserved exported hypothetical protein [uncultured Paludibacter sp.]|uniref:DUF4349 domain-containing protein n=1 Tax=uncultured Paludibacter sp. TaxID=497635 RepID=A0A653A8A7_9BACT|nr:conserved exported hypothetical protein [uncultured Paludibacter sp.]
MKTTKVLSVLFVIFILYNCSKPALKTEYESYATDSVVSSSESDKSGFVSSSAAVENNKDAEHKFVRTADLKFKVKSVLKSTYNIEDITVREGGFVTLSNLNSQKNETKTTAISFDSTLETTYFTVSNTMTIRIPNVKLDTVLKQIANNIEYLDFRIIKADDVRLQLLSNDLAQKRSAKHEERLTKAIDNQGKKLYETSDAEENLVNVQEQADNAKVANLSLNDQIKYSTVNIEIYQRETVKREIYANEKNISEYTPGFGFKLWDAIKYGWSIIQSIIVFFVQFWTLFLLFGIGYFIYKKIKINNKEKNTEK